MSADPHATSDTADRHRGDDPYDNLEPLFIELAALDTGDPRRAALRDRIMRRALPLAENIARRFRGRGVEDDDLRQVACLGLVNAVDRFDPSHGSSFLSFAVPTVMGEVRRHFRDQTWSVRVPRGTKETHAKIGPAVEELAQRLGRMPRPSEIAAELDLDRTEVTQALVAANAYRADSLDAALTDGDDDTIAPALSRLGAVESAYGLLEDAMAVRPLLEALPERERQVLVWRFSDNLSQAEIAARLGVSQMQISRTLTRIFTTLRDKALAEPEHNEHLAEVRPLRSRRAA
ncbi:SigB/SigF/SigG family RNA polymerase sigma factor [Nocardia takedensis]